MSNAFFWPMFAQVLLVAAVWVRLYVQRISEMRRKRINPQRFAAPGQKAVLLEETSAADNFANLFEVPVLFFAGCLAAITLGAESMVLLSAAWTFVGLRVAHSLIHCTYNRIVHRFSVFVVSTLVLFAFWLGLAVEALAAG